MNLDKINKIEQLLGIELTRYQKIMLIYLLEDKDEYYNNLTRTEYIASLRSKEPIKGRLIWEKQKDE